MHWLKLLKNNLNQQQFKSKHLQASYLEVFSLQLLDSCSGRLADFLFQT
jgi:hypothetical protein